MSPSDPTDEEVASATADAKPSAEPEEKKPATVPADSGTGRRIVYSLGEKRVWLVDASDAPRRSFAVWPGTVAPDPGTYTIGKDGVVDLGKPTVFDKDNIDDFDF